MFIFFYEKENEPKEIAPATRPFGLPGASRIGRSLWNSLALRQPQRLFARFCDARRVTKGKVKLLAVVSPPLMGLPEARYAEGESLIWELLSGNYSSGFLIRPRVAIEMAAQAAFDPRDFCISLLQS